MRLRNTEYAYGQIARLLHWCSVAALLAAVVWGTEAAAHSDDKAVLGQHVAVGLLLLALMLARFAWRISNLNPLLSYRLAAWHKRGAVSVHWLIYAAVVTQCLIGIAQVLVAEQPVMLFEQVPLPLLESASMEVRERLNDVHRAISELIYIVIALHVAGAIYHQLFGVVDEPAEPL